MRSARAGGAYRGAGDTGRSRISTGGALRASSARSQAAAASRRRALSAETGKNAPASRSISKFPSSSTVSPSFSIWRRTAASSRGRPRAGCTTSPSAAQPPSVRRHGCPMRAEKEPSTRVRRRSCCQLSCARRICSASVVRKSASPGRTPSGTRMEPSGAVCTRMPWSPPFPRASRPSPSCRGAERRTLARPRDTRWTSPTRTPQWLGRAVAMICASFPPGA